MTDATQSAREEILARIQQSTRRNSNAQESENIAAQRMAQHARGPLPAFTEQALERFTAKAQQASASVISINSLSECSKTISAYLEEHDLGQNIAAAPSPLLDSINWPDNFKVERRIAQATDQVALSVATAGIAETGTLALISGKETPTSLNFLPDNYICLLQKQDLVMHMEDVWDRIRDRQGNMPRTLNYITGPSRTADVEQTIQLGAHGPRRLLVVIVDN